jgi:hypothetical protein
VSLLIRPTRRYQQHGKSREALVDQQNDIMTSIPEARWDYKSFYGSPDSKDPPTTCDITLDKAGFVELAGYDRYMIIRALPVTILLSSLSV